MHRQIVSKIKIISKQTKINQNKTNIINISHISYFIQLFVIVS